MPIDFDPREAGPDIPMARPVSMESVPEAESDRESLSSSAAYLTPFRSILQLILVLLAGGAGVVVGSVVAGMIELPDERWAHLVVTGFAGLASVLAVFALVRSAGQRPAAIGWRSSSTMQDVAIGVVAAFAAYAVMILAASMLVLIRPDLMERTSEAQRAIESTFPPVSIPVMLLLMAFVAVWEEIVFRGFLLTRLYALLRRWWLTVLVGAVLFSFGHGYQGEMATVVIGFIGVLLGVLFVWRRSLLPAVAFHATFNTIGLLLLRSQSDTWH